MNTFEAVDLIKHHHIILKSELNEERLQYDFDNKELTEEVNNELRTLYYNKLHKYIKDEIIPYLQDNEFNEWLYKYMHDKQFIKEITKKSSEEPGSNTHYIIKMYKLAAGERIRNTYFKFTRDYNMDYKLGSYIQRYNGKRF